jgi:hypothetical protein
MPQDPVLSQAANMYAPTAGPFSDVLTSGLVPGTQPQQNERPSGFMGGGGKLAFIGTKLLEGLQRGKVMAYIGEESKRSQTYNSGLQMYDSQYAAAVRDGNTERAQEIDKARLDWVHGHALQELSGGDATKAKSKAKK